MDSVALALTCLFCTCNGWQIHGTVEPFQNVREGYHQEIWQALHSNPNWQSLKKLAKLLLAYTPAAAFFTAGTQHCFCSSGVLMHQPGYCCKHLHRRCSAPELVAQEEKVKVEDASAPAAQVVSLGMQVSAHFKVVRTDTGATLDTTEGGPPLSFVCGLKQKGVLKGLDTAVQGMAVGDTQELPLSDFGEKDPAKLAHLPLDRLPPGVQAGAKLQVGGGGQVLVAEVNDTHATVDFNHPLAGVPLILTVTVVSAKDLSRNWQAQEGGSQEVSKEKRIEKLQSRTSIGGCVVCCKPATMRCSKGNDVLYCSDECRKQHWDVLGYAETWDLDNKDFQLDQYPPNPVDVVEMSTLTPELFQKYCSNEGRPFIMRGVFGKAFEESMWDLDSLVKSFGSDSPVAVRYYRGVATEPGKWVDVGFCDHSRSTVERFASMIRIGHAKMQDAYVNCDVVGTPAASSKLGEVLKAGLAQVGTRTGLEPTKSMGEAVNIWWGAPGHTEQLHCDANDGTLVQLRGRKKVILFPASEWLNLYPFPTGIGINEAWSRINLQAVDVKSYPHVRSALPKRCEVILGEGDALYIPACWAHQITGLEDDGDSSESSHVFSVNRFWRTDMKRSLRWLPEEVGKFIKEQFPDGI